MPSTPPARLRQSLSLIALFTPLVWAFARGPQRGVGSPSAGASAALAPVRLSTLGLAPGQARVGAELRFGVRVEGGAGPCSLTLMNPQPGMVFEPVHQRQPPFTCSLRWLVPEQVGERVELLFRAGATVTPGGPSPGSPGATLRVPILVSRDSGALVRVGDVSGDGVLDVVAVARQADRGGLPNTGVAFVWLGSSTPSGTPSATLELPNAVAGDRLGDAADPGLQLVDISGDGVLDILIAAEGADWNNVVDAGGLFAFFGGANLQGTRAPDVSFHQPSPQQGDRFGSMPLLLDDLTGDGIPELVAGSSWADLGGHVDVGGFWVWKTGSELLGNPEPSPLRELSIQGALAGDRLGFASGRGLQSIDLNGDAISDLVIGAQLADRGGLANLGALYVWQGGDQFEFGGAPEASLDTTSSSSPAAGDQLGLVSGQGIQFADLTGDGRLDIVVGASRADHEFVVDSGCVYVFEGSADLVDMGGPPRMELGVSTAQPGDALGEGTGQTIQFAQLTGDALLDVLVSAELADGGEGRVYVFEGSASQTGTVEPVGELFAGSGIERLGQVSGQGVFAVDLTADGLLDVVVGAQLADIDPWLDMGRISVWDGQSGFTSGLRLPDWSLDAPDMGTNGGDRMGAISGPGMQFFDVSGDGWLDLVTGASSADVFGSAQVGAVYVWEGGPNLTSFPTATLLAPSAQAGDQLARGAGQGIRVHDLDQDGVLDLVVSAEFADDGTNTDVGAFYVWRGGPSLGSSGPLYTLRGSDAVAGDRLGGVAGAAILLADLTGDSIDDILIGSQRADVFGVANAGAYYVWDGAQLAPGAPLPSSVLTTSGLNAGDQLGLASVGMQVFDMTDDGVFDLLLPAAFADQPGALNTGALYFWSGANQIGLDPHPLADVTWTDASAVAGDQLGG